MLTKGCDDESRSSREQQIQVIAHRLGVLTEKFEEFMAQQCARLSKLADASLSGSPNQDHWEQERAEFTIQIRQERDLLAEAWERLEVERREQILCRQADQDVERGCNFSDIGIADRATTSMLAHSDNRVEWPKHNDPSMVRQFHELRQEMSHQSQRVL